MARASEGIWMWDAIDSSNFVDHACIVMALGDMLGSAKLNGMSGHSAFCGDRFTLVQGAKASITKGAKSQYYPFSPPESEKFNPERPLYDLNHLPMRTQSEYWKIIHMIDSAPTKAEKARISKSTGVVRLPLCAASVAFIHPSFFPIDPFHLFYENCAAFIWDIWVQFSKADEIFHLNEEQRREFGACISDSMNTLPPIFCGPVRDPYLSRNSQYKIYEWMALVHWYIIPIGLELGFNSIVLSNFTDFVNVIEFAMTVKDRTEQDLKDIKTLIIKFLKQFEDLYVHGVPENISRNRLCIFQLIHIPLHIKWNGSVRVGSQATVERGIGEMGRKIRSKKAPFANLANQIFDKELIKILMLYYPDLDTERKNVDATQFKLMQKQKVSHKHVDQRVNKEIEAIGNRLGKNVQEENIPYERWGKLKLKNGKVLQSELSISKSKSSRISPWFEVCKLRIKYKFKVKYSTLQTHDNLNQPISHITFGKALAFYELKVDEKQIFLVVYNALSDVTRPLGQIRGQWQTSISVLEIEFVQDIVGIWVSPKKAERVYVLRKHPGLEMLTSNECGIEDEDKESWEPEDDI